MQPTGKRIFGVFFLNLEHQLLAGLAGARPGRFRVRDFGLVLQNAKL